MRELLAILTAVSLLLPALSCGNGPAAGDGRLKVAVSIPPQAHFVEAVGGDRVEVGVLLPPGASPATYDPGPAEMRSVAEADLYMTMGVPFEEAWLPRLESAAPGITVVQTHGGIHRLPIDGHGTGSASSHDHGHAHEANAPDPHIWLSPELVRKQAETVAEALMEADPDGREAYSRNLEELQRELTDLQEELSGILADARGSAFVVFHPSWGYFADEFGLVQLPIEVEGQEPSPSELADLVDEARSLEVPVVLVAPQFSRRTAEAVADEIGARVEVADPLARNWSENLVSVASSIAGAE